MAVVFVKGKKVEIDIEDELREFRWGNAKWSEDKLISSSPFRDDDAPSFFISLITGGWGDSGASFDNISGNIFDILSYLRGTTIGEVGDYLEDKYGVLYDVESSNINIEIPKVYRVNQKISYIVVEDYVQSKSPYVESRGIGEDVQKEFGIGYNSKIKGYTALPWYTPDNKLANVKYRSTGNKSFFYEKGGTKISELLFGIHAARGSREVVVVEGEFDAMSWGEAGIPSVAVGGSFISNAQIQLLIREGFDTIYIGGDNDNQGRKLNDKLLERLKKVANLRIIDYGEKDIIDANDVLTRFGVDKLRDLKKEAKYVRKFEISVDKLNI